MKRTLRNTATIALIVGLASLTQSMPITAGNSSSSEGSSSFGGWWFSSTTQTEQPTQAQRETAALERFMQDPNIARIFDDARSDNPQERGLANAKLEMWAQLLLQEVKNNQKKE